MVPSKLAIRMVLGSINAHWLVKERWPTIFRKQFWVRLRTCTESSCRHKQMYLLLLQFVMVFMDTLTKILSTHTIDALSKNNRSPSKLPTIILSSVTNKLATAISNVIMAP